MTNPHVFLSSRAVPARPKGLRSRAAPAAVAIAVLLGSVMLATPAAAQERPTNLVRSGPNLTLVVANCDSVADTTTALNLARQARNAAFACLDADGIGADIADLVAEFAPDRVMVVGGADVVSPAVMGELSAAVRAAYRWAVIQRLGGATRVETAAEAVRVALDTPERVGPDTVTLIVANGWNDADIDTAREFAARFQDVAIAYFSPLLIADGLDEATASLIADYRPHRVVFAGLADEAGMAAEAATAAVLEAIESEVHVERVAVATGAPSPSVDTATLTSSARETFEVISRGERVRPSEADEGDGLPFLALTEASGIRGVGSTLFTVRADGSDRILRTVDHYGWEWDYSDGQRLAWADDEKRVMVATPDADGELIVSRATWPWWSPDGSHLITWKTTDTDGDDRSDAYEMVLRNDKGHKQRSMGQMDRRTYVYAETRDLIWSRDGTYMAYVTGHIDPETSKEINEARIEPTDGSAAPVTLADDAIILRWSPTGTHLLYATPAECGEGESSNIWDMWVVAADGSNQRRIDLIDYPAYSIVIINPWSRDGKHVAYEAVDPQDCSIELRVSTVDGDAEPVSIAADAHFLGWSPDSTYLEYGEETDRPVTDFISPERSWIAHRDGSSKRFIGEISPHFRGWIIWSDDGKHIAYTELLRDADGNPAGLRARTERSDGVAESTTLAESGNALSFSRDGRLAYVAQHDDDGDGVPDREALYLRTPESLDDDVELVHTLPAPTRVAIWSPDDSHLIYGSGSIESLIGWFRDRARGVDVWGVATGNPRWMHRLITDVTWGEWQPQPNDEADAE